MHFKLVFKKMCNCDVYFYSGWDVSDKCDSHNRAQKRHNDFALVLWLLHLSDTSRPPYIYFSTNMAKCMDNAFFKYFGPEWWSCRKRIIKLKKPSAYFLPCHMTNPAQSYSCPTVHECSQPACPEPSPNVVASQSEEMGKKAFIWI